ncbi:archaellum biogenesis ATPase FlaH [Chromobacterium alkanivorans]|uniref:ATP-binding protein n=1 Tax=Chromobacterium alkanivorans TaxID=1071719 RepID=UPI002168E7A6|nr:ATP-binding protein [Chromobacterium alkanivorans]MCS3805833.1 archaellum biogenesis ATPase FlaH [Chromobacterium alkanivorans]MCS3820171.1 archaellum biogenesis ATPase FlaH [Chromobacterium alkanivorans]MCS3874929.1 archaellum biogenesis ATPase FlaH [Chromobacterium alkanivorans]
MAIQGYSKSEFGEELARVLSPARPISSIEKLYGREIEIETIERSLYQPGRHIFIYGDRGIGKSSLAATAAYQYHNSETSPIFVGGSCDETFKSIIANIANKAMSISRFVNTKKTSNFGFEWKGVKFNSGIETNSKDIASQIQGVGDAADLLDQISKVLPKKTVIVIDEFDAIPEIDDRNKFASLLKQLGDQDINIRFIFTGIAKSIDELLGAHQSAYRQLETIELANLSWDARYDLVKNAMSHFNITIPDDINWRIAMICAGYPYYIHLIAEKILWEVFSDDKLVDQVSLDHYGRGLNSAVRSVTAELRKPYEIAVIHRSEEYEDVVWSTADTDDLLRPLSEMRKSYEAIILKRRKSNPISSAAYSQCIRNLKNEKFGAILIPLIGRKGWYGFRENMLRGFIRLQAAANGIELNGSYKIPKQTMRATVNARSGTYGSTIPYGVNVNRRINDEND